MVQTMQTVYTLSSLPVGKSAVIQAVHGSGAVHERLMDLGFGQGSTVTCLFSSIFGDPRAYRIKNTTIALRSCDARHVEIQQDGGNI